MRHLTTTYTLLLHCTQPHSKTTRRRLAEACQVKHCNWWSSFDVHLSFCVIPYWIVYVLLLRKAWYAYKEAFDIDVLIFNFFKLCFIITITQILRMQEYFNFFIGKSVINSTIYTWQKAERNPYSILRNKQTKRNQSDGLSLRD